MQFERIAEVPKKFFWYVLLYTVVNVIWGDIKKKRRLFVGNGKVIQGGRARSAHGAKGTHGPREPIRTGDLARAPPYYFSIAKQNEKVSYYELTNRPRKQANPTFLDFGAIFSGFGPQEWSHRVRTTISVSCKLPFSIPRDLSPGSEHGLVSLLGKLFCKWLVSH